MTEDKIATNRLGKDVIKVTNTYNDELYPSSLDVYVSLISNINNVKCEVCRKRLANELIQKGLTITDWINDPINGEFNSKNNKPGGTSLSFWVKSIPSKHFLGIKNIILGELDSLGNSIDLKFSCSSEEENAVQKALIINKQIADEISSVLSVKLLGIENENINIECTDPFLDTAPQVNDNGSLTISITVKTEIEYVVTKFSNFRYNTNAFWKLINKSIIKKQIKYTFFELWFSVLAKFQTNNIPKSLPHKSKKALVVGHFSFPGGGGTFGDIEAMQMVSDWLEESNVEYDVASNIEDGVDGINILHLDKNDYGLFIYVCGPWYSNEGIQKVLLRKFDPSVKIGVNLTTFEEGNSGFNYLLSRDNPDEEHADIAFANVVEKIPVVGILLVDRQKKYGIRQRHLYIRSVISNYLQKSDLAPIWLDTNANNNIMNINQINQFESIVSRTDLVITNRLHGIVLSLKNSIPVIAIDPIAGGGKITAQAKALDWPILISAEEFSENKLHQTISYCFDNDLIDAINNSQRQAHESIEQTKGKFLQIIENL